MKKFLLSTVALLLIGGGNLKVFADLRTDWNPSDAFSTTWNAETHTLSWNKNWANVLYTGFAPKSNPNTTEVNLSRYEKLHYNITSLSGTASDANGAYIELKVRSTGKSDINLKLYEGEHDIVFADYAATIDFSKILELTVSATYAAGSADGDPGSAVIPEMYLYYATVAGTDEQLAAATSQITVGRAYFISCEYNSTTYYLKKDGSNHVILTSDKSEATMFTFYAGNTTEGYKSTAWYISTDGRRFTNGDGNPPTLKGYLRTSTEDRIWESQVLYYDGSKFAIRATNSTGTSWGANRYWTVKESSGNVIADYTEADGDAQFVWSLVDASVGNGIGNGKIVQGEDYIISAVYNNVTYYLTSDGHVSSNEQDACPFTFSNGADGLYSNRWFITTEGKHFTNGDGNPPTLRGYLRQSTDSRNFESQVLFYNGSKYAIRATNANSNEWGARRFWTVKESSGNVIAEYTENDDDVQFVWTITRNARPITSFGEEVTDISYLTGGGSFVIVNSGNTALLAFPGYEAEGKASNVNEPYSSFYDYYSMEALPALDVDEDGTDDDATYYRIAIKNAEGTAKPSNWWGANYIDIIGWNALWSTNCAANDEANNHYGRDGSYRAVWTVEYVAGSGFKFRNPKTGRYLTVAGSSSSETFVKLYKSYSTAVVVPPHDVELEFNNYGFATTDVTGMSAEGGLSYNASTGVLTSNGAGTAGTLTLEFLDPVNLEDLNTFEVKRSGDNSIVNRLKYYDSDDNLINTWNNARLQNDGLDYNATNAFKTHNPVKKLVWELDAESNTSSKTLTITGIEWQKKTLAAIKGTDITTLPYQVWDTDGDNDANATGNSTPTKNFCTLTGDVIYGKQNTDDSKNYVDLTNYKKLIIRGYGTIRLFYNWHQKTGEETEDIKPIDATSFVNNTTTVQTMELDIPTFMTNNHCTHFHLIGLKPLYQGTAFVESISVTDGTEQFDYAISGKGGLKLQSAIDALADENATAIDARGVEVSDARLKETLTPANSNCLIVANANQLDNASNVIVSSTCANLVLTDGHPFKAPVDFTATAASYGTTINATAKAGTLCLPFAATIPNDVEAWTLEYTSGETVTATPVKNNTIPANTPVLLNGEGGVTFNGPNADVDADATNTVDAMTGVFEAGYVPVGSYVLQNGSEGLGFYQVAAANTIPINPFRAYLTAQAGAGAKLRIVFNDNDAVAIDSVKEQTADDGAIYTLTGIRVAQPTKGIYVKNGRKFIVK